MTIQLPTQATKAPPNPTKLRVMVYGPPGIGKTTWAAATFKGALYIDTENGSEGVECVRQKVNSWGEFCDTVAALSQSKDQYPCVIVDTINRLRDWARMHVMGGEKKPMLHQWGDINAALQKQIDLLLCFGGVVFLAHEQENPMDERGRKIVADFRNKKEKDKNPAPEHKLKYHLLTPQLGGSALTGLTSMCDIVARACWDSKGERVLVTGGSMEIVARDRTGVLPAVVPLSPAGFLEPFRDAVRASRGGAAT